MGDEAGAEAPPAPPEEEAPPAEQPAAEEAPAPTPPTPQSEAEPTPPAEAPPPPSSEPIVEPTAVPSEEAAPPSLEDKKKDAVEEKRRMSRERISSQARVSVTSRTSLTQIGRDKSEGLNSRARIVLGSVISIRRSSLTGDTFDRTKVARYMNTYVLEPIKPFNAEKVEGILKQVLFDALEGNYDEQSCIKKAKFASSAIRAGVKALEYDRCKLVCIVSIGEKQSQHYFQACKFLWDAERDKYAIFTHETTHMFGTAMCFGFYYE